MVDLTALDELHQLSKQNRGNTGCLQLLISEHPDERDYILAAVDHPAAATVVAKHLTEHLGLERRIGADSIRRHRTGMCKCRIQ